MVTELVVPLRGSKLRAASRREVRAIRCRTTNSTGDRFTAYIEYS
ncbi:MULTISPECIES: hypothetical protein [unclassified Nostoc]|nr:hypothetical protein [Nostoc sp. DedQUE03]MDZ7975381.1 hypothetical protein [Nostoc sp. DedQUE03]MDZ8045400.1 hypothetical protein [Nostoc sp. DedQUE02]